MIFFVNVLNCISGMFPIAVSDVWPAKLTQTAIGNMPEIQLNTFNKKIQTVSYPTGCGTQPETVSKIKVRRTGRRKVTFLPPKGYLLPPKTLSFASPKTTFCDITDSQVFTRRAEGIVHVSEIMVGQHVRHGQTTTCKMI